VRRIQIIDLDGCISDDRWRRGRIREEELDKFNRFHEYHAACHFDKPLNLHLVTEKITVVLTGRPVNYHEQTVMWLAEVAHIAPLHMLMRNRGDHRDSVDLKRSMVAQLLDWNSYNIDPRELVSAMDDRADIVAMYRKEYNINARIVRIGEEEHSNG
jgi:hypothetical protein